MSRLDVRDQIRQSHKQYRRSLTPEQLNTFSEQLTSIISNHDLFLSSQHIGFYMANNGEIDPAPLMEIAWQQNKDCYLPVLESPSFPHLDFIHYKKNEPLKKNKYNIPEPPHDDDKLIPPDKLDIVFTPLVAVDAVGNRLGMGAGYYDRTFAFKKENKSSTPLLIGLSYEEQIVEHIPPEPWDVPLDGVFTEETYRELV